MKHLFFLFSTVLLVTGCDSNRVFEDYAEFDNKAWKADSPAIFEFQIKDSTKKYNLYYNVRNSLNYPYARLFVQYSLLDSTGTEISKKLVSNYLFDQKTGRPLGRSGLGDVFDNQFLLLKNHHFSQGVYRLHIEQFNRQDTLQGILAIGMRVEVENLQ